MFRLRSVTMEDLPDLYKLSQLGVFISLPRDKEMLKNIIASSVKSFKSPHPVFHKNNYVFVIEDLEENEVIGVSVIHAQHGTEYEPHFFLRVSQEYKFSKSINTGFVHGTLKLGYETNGPTEIGGLVLNPAYRNHKEKLGKQLSYVRFLYMSQYPERFKEEIHCELMPPFDEKGQSLLWEAIGRRFMNMDYHEADKLSRQNKEFILSLYPSEAIYVTLLPMEAKNSIGKVGPDTLPVKRMLENVGFKYIQEVDPFDGGPHYRCPLKDIIPIKERMTATLNTKGTFTITGSSKALLMLKDPEYDFCAVAADINIHAVPESNPELVLNEELLKAFPFTDQQEINLIFL